MKLLDERIAEELRAELGRRHMSVRAVASATGISVATMSRYFTGETVPKLDRLDLICRAFDMSIPDLLHKVEVNGGYTPLPLHPDGGGNMTPTFPLRRFLHLPAIFTRPFDLRLQVERPVGV